jgi:hypothetical protein
MNDVLHVCSRWLYQSGLDWENVKVTEKAQHDNGKGKESVAEVGSRGSEHVVSTIVGWEISKKAVMANG